MQLMSIVFILFGFVSQSAVAEVVYNPVDRKTLRADVGSVENLVEASGSLDARDNFQLIRYLTESNSEVQSMLESARARCKPNCGQLFFSPTPIQALYKRKDWSRASATYIHTLGYQNNGRFSADFELSIRVEVTSSIPPTRFFKILSLGSMRQAQDASFRTLYDSEMIEVEHPDAENLDHLLQLTIDSIDKFVTGLMDKKGHPLSYLAQELRDCPQSLDSLRVSPFDWNSCGQVDVGRGMNLWEQIKSTPTQAGRMIVYPVGFLKTGEENAYTQMALVKLSMEVLRTAPTRAVIRLRAVGYRKMNQSP